MAAGPTEINIKGKTLPVFTMKNLESMNQHNLRMRGLDIKDLLVSMGAGDVSMPRHQEALRDWIIATQDSLLGMGGGAGAPQQRMPPSQGQMDHGYMEQQMRPTPESRRGGGFPMSDTAMTDDQEAYSSARATAAAARQRNQGSTNILTWA
jgi:hypothetical protein